MTKSNQQETRIQSFPSPGLPYLGGSMRLTKEMAQQAKNELLEILAQHPGQTTSELSGTPQFHGARTLTNRQIIRLLRSTGKVVEFVVGYGMRTATGWRLAK
jgi:hypothetical protein